MIETRQPLSHRSFRSTVTTMSRPAAAAAASGRKAQGPPDDERPSKFMATRNAKGEVLKTIVQKQAEINKLHTEMNQLIAQFMSMTPSAVYTNPMENGNRRSDLDNFRMASKRLHEDLAPSKFGTSQAQIKARVENSSKLYLGAMTFLRDIVKNNRGEWMGEITGSYGPAADARRNMIWLSMNRTGPRVAHDEVNRGAIIQRYAANSGVEFPQLQYPVTEEDLKDPENTRRIMRRKPANLAWNTVMGPDSQLNEFFIELERLSECTWDDFQTIFRSPTTLLDIVEDLMGLNPHLINRISFTLAAINVFGGARLWTAVLWCLVVNRMPGIVGIDSGLWAAQVLDFGEGPDKRVTIEQLERVGWHGTKGSEWPEWIAGDSVTWTSTRHALRPFAAALHDMDNPEEEYEADY